LGRRKRSQDLITKTAGEEKMGRERKTHINNDNNENNTQETSNFCKYHSTFLCQK
jgi:hypothetical protein